MTHKPFYVLVLLLLYQTTTHALPFDTHTARLTSIPTQYSFDAVIEATDKATVSAETSGRVAEILVDVGDFVKQNSVIIRLTSEKHRAQLNAAEAKVSEAQANADIAAKEFERIKEVFAKKLVAKSAYDKAEAELNAANQRLAASQAQLNETKAQLRYTVVRAPFSGIVSERLIETGEAANPGTPLMSGISLSNLRAVTSIPQSLAESLRESGKAHIVSPADAKIIAASKLVIYPEANPIAHTFKARAYIPGDHTESLYPGMMVKVNITAGEQTKLMVPRQAVVFRGELQAVYVVKDNSVMLRQVRTGRTLNERDIEILAGLDDGESIALDPVRAGVFLKEQH